MTEDHIDLSISNKFNLQGARLSTITQALAYKGIRGNITLEPRIKTIINLDLTRYVIQSITGQLESNTTIWTRCKNKDIQ
jgi:hypothetical protein